MTPTPATRQGAKVCRLCGRVGSRRFLAMPNPLGPSFPDVWVCTMDMSCRARRQKVATR